MLCSITFGMFSGNNSLWDIHLLYIVLLGKFHSHKKVWYFLVILYLSLVLISL